MYHADDAERSYGESSALKWFNFPYYYICKHVIKWVCLFSLGTAYIYLFQYAA